MYDIYLYQGCFRNPDLNKLLNENPLLINSGEHIKLQCHKSGFLGLDLPSDTVDECSTAAELLDTLELAGARGLVLPSSYRQPKIIVEMAYLIAEPVIEQQKRLIEQEKRSPPRTYEPLKFLRENVMTWSFIANSKELVELGYIPGGIIINIDKLDGHVWTDKEQVCMSGEEYLLESSTTLKPKEVLDILAEQLGWEWVMETQDNKAYLKASAALSVRVFELKSQQLLEMNKRRLGFISTTRILFNLTKYKAGYSTAGNLMLQAVKIFLNQEAVDAVLLLDAGSPVSVIQRISGKWVFNEEWYSQRNISLPEVDISGKLR